MDNPRPFRPRDARPAPPPFSLVPTPLQVVIDRDDFASATLRSLAAVCGGVEALETLSTDPIVDDLPALDTVPEAHQPLAAEIIAEIEAAGARILDEELQVIVRRLVAAAAVHDSRPLRTRTTPVRLAAALTWIALRGNMQLGPRARLTAEELCELFRVTPCGSLGQSIARKMHLLAPVDEMSFHRLPTKNIALGDVHLLHSRTRQWLVQRRDETVRLADQVAAGREKRRPLKQRSDGHIALRGREVQVLGAVKGMAVEGRATVMVLLGEDAMDPDDVLALSVPDARQLVTWLQRALDAPFPRAVG
jgi:hypothetical protein